LSAIHELIEAAEDPGFLGHDWPTLAAAAKAELKEREANLYYALQAQAASLHALDERDRAAAELKEAVAEYLRAHVDPADVDEQLERQRIRDRLLSEAAQRWAAKVGAR
jgi:hypothetical protein